MLRAKENGSAGRSLSEEVEGELIDLMYSSLPSIVLITVAFAVTGFAAMLRTGDATLAMIGAAGGIVGSARIGLCLAHRRLRRSDRIARRDFWRRWYAIGGWAFSCCIGLFVLRAFVLGDHFSQLAAMIMAVSYGAGMIVRVSVVPQVARVQLLIALGPIATGFAMQPGIENMLLAGLCVLYILGGMQLITYLHATILERLVARDELRALASTDHLTGLPNRRFIMERLAERVGSAPSTAVLMLDLDGFKAVNDRLGHETGDQLLLAVAARLRTIAEGRAVPARLGGDEFVLILDDGSAEEAERLAALIRTGLARPFALARQEIGIGACVGVAVPRDGTTPSALLRSADNALYHAKAARGPRRRAGDVQTPPEGAEAA